MKYKWQFYTAKETSIKWLDVVEMDVDELIKNWEAEWISFALTMSLIIWFFIVLYSFI